MIKKLFLFTLLVSSFLVISCNNKDTTGPTTPTVTSIDSKWYGTYKYSLAEGGMSVESTITVSASGIEIKETVNGKTESSSLGNENLVKVSDDVYKTKEVQITEGLAYIEFKFSGTTLTMTDYVNGQASVPIVHTLQSVIDSKWYDTYKYLGTSETGKPYESTLIVDENGISFTTIQDGQPETGNFLNNQLIKVSENVYQTEELPGPTYVKFEFVSTDTGATLTVTDYIDGQAGTQEVHNRQ